MHAAHQIQRRPQLALGALQLDSGVLDIDFGFSNLRAVCQCERHQILNGGYLFHVRNTQIVRGNDSSLGYTRTRHSGTAEGVLQNGLLLEHLRFRLRESVLAAGDFRLRLDDFNWGEGADLHLFFIVAIELLVECESLPVHFYVLIEADQV